MDNKITERKLLKYVGKEPTLVRFTAGGGKEIVKKDQQFEADLSTAENLLIVYSDLFVEVKEAKKKEIKVEKKVVAEKAK